MFHMATSRLKAGQIAEATSDFKRSAAIKPKPAIQDGLGQCYHKLNDHANAILAFNNAITAESRNIEFLKNRSQCYFDMGNFEACINDLANALDINSRDPQVLYKQGLAYFAFGKYKKAILTMKIALRYKPYLTYEADIFYHLGLAYCRLEKFEKSIFPYTKCIEKVPSTSDVRYVHERAKAF